MGDFFYGIGLFVVIFNVITLFRHRRIFETTEWLIKFKKVTNRNPTDGDFREKGDKDLLLFWSFTVVFTVIWMFFGLLSSEWMIFIGIFLMNIFLNYNKKIFAKISKIKLFLSFIKSFIGISIIMYLVVSHFHPSIIGYFTELFKH